MVVHSWINVNTVWCKGWLSLGLHVCFAVEVAMCYGA